MCQKERKVFGLGLRMPYRVLLVSFCLLLLVALPLAAWPTRQDRNEEVPVQVESTTQEAVVTITPVSPPAESTRSSENSELVSQIQSLLSTASSTSSSNTETLQAIKTEIAVLSARLEAADETEQIEDGVAEDLRAEISSTNIRLDEAIAKNGEQADKIATLESEAKSKPYFKIGGVIGFEDAITPTWGLSTALGVKIGKNALVETGIEYDFGNFKSAPNLTKFDITKMRVTASFGWLF